METHAEVMARTMAGHGSEYVFGLPGGEILAFVDACRRAGLRFLLTGHEASAAWMAQVVGQLSGTPGICASTLGPGATNLMTAVANAWLDRAPMLAVTAQIPKSARETMTHQRLPLERLFAPITKASLAIGERDTETVVEESFALAATPRPGPVHLALASDVAIEECVIRKEARLSAHDELAPSLQPIVERVNGAARPLVLIGLGASPAAGPAIGRLIDRLQAPFVVTPKVKGIVAEDHPLFAGVASGMAMDREIVETLQAADLVIAIGFDPVECDKTWFASLDVVALDNSSMAEGSYSPQEVLGDLPALVASLTDGISEPRPWSRDFRVLRPERSEPAKGLSPLRLIEELRAIFPRDGIAACDVGSHKLAVGQFWRSFEPDTFLMSNGLSGMGFGIPASIAAQLVHPGKSVIAMVGDGGMLMMLHDLVLIRELALPIVIVVFCDRSLSLIRLSGERRGFQPYGVDFTPPDFVAVAEGFGIAARRTESLKEVREYTERALRQRIPFLLEAAVDNREYGELIR